MRPSNSAPKLTPRVIEQAAELARKGASFGTVAKAVGVSRPCMHYWLQRGEAELNALESPEDEPPTLQGQFAKAYRAAQAEAALNAESRVYIDNPLAWLKNGPGREDWSDRVKVEHSGQIDHNVFGEIDVVAPVPIPRNLDEVRATLAILAETREFDGLSYEAVEVEVNGEWVPLDSLPKRIRQDARVVEAAPMPQPTLMPHVVEAEVVTDEPTSVEESEPEPTSLPQEETPPETDDEKATPEHTILKGNWPRRNHSPMPYAKGPIERASSYRG